MPDVDVLVNNLGIFGTTPALEISDDEWRRYFEVNVLASVRMIRSLLPGMKDRAWGRILNVASDSAVVIPAEMIHYGMSKTALLAVTRGFAKEAAGTGVTVNSLIAGPTHTGGVEDFVYELVDPELPWGRPGGGPPPPAPRRPAAAPRRPLRPGPASGPRPCFRAPFRWDRPRGRGSLGASLGG
ncbi:Short-chain dehydrogenase OS=Streptomyces antimycoticus OX=68175 GN=SANT12839_008480 PE=3 SV=1 [Streptomyces antimycoticus]